MKRWIAETSTQELLDKSLEQPAKLLAEGKVVAFPTETVYGLGGNALSDTAVKQIFTAKGRPADNPLIVHVAEERHDWHGGRENDSECHSLDQKVLAWPFNRTCSLQLVCFKVLHCRQEVLVISSLSDHAGQPTVGLRMPNHPVALALIRLAGVPIAAPSANVSGKPSPTSADHVLHDLDGRIAGVVDGGSCNVGVESTVVDCSGPDEDTVIILRPGGISREQLQTVIKTVLVDPALSGLDEAPKAPGMKYTHYAPRAPVRIVDGNLELFMKAVIGLKNRGKKVGVLCTSDVVSSLSGADHVVVCGSRDDMQSVARELYSSLRKFDQTEVDIILAESFPTSHIGEAVMNRLSKSAGNSYVRSLDDL